MEQEERGPFTIGEVAERADVTPRTVRYYVAEGLLPPPGGAGQQRVYSYEHLLRLQAIKRLKAEYLPLNEIRERLAGLTLADLEDLATQEMPAPRNRALSYIESVLASRPMPSPARASVDRYQLRAHAPSAQVRPDALAHAVPDMASPTEPVPPHDIPPAGLWQRVVLAPGVELHYQPTSDPERDAAIARLIGEAARLLAPGAI